MLKKIIEMCREKGISLAELERKAGLESRTIYKWGKSVPSADKAAAVASVLETTVEELLKPEDGE